MLMSRTRTIRLPDRSLAWMYLVGVVAGLVAGAFAYRRRVAEGDLILVELGGADQPWPPPATAESALRWDFLLIAGYGLALLLGLLLASAVFGRHALVDWPWPDRGRVRRRE